MTSDGEDGRSELPFEGPGEGRPELQARRGARAEREVRDDVVPVPEAGVWVRLRALRGGWLCPPRRLRGSRPLLGGCRGAGVLGPSVRGGRQPRAAGRAGLASLDAACDLRPRRRGRIGVRTRPVRTREPDPCTGGGGPGRLGNSVRER